MNPSPGLQRTLGLLDATSLLVGIVIGTGIFMTSGIMAQSLAHPSLLLLAWALGGLLTLAGALAGAEMGAALPEAGGHYVYLREAFGPLAAFLFGWLTLWVYQPGALGAVAVGFAAYLGYFVPALGTENVVVTLPLSSGVAISAGQLLAAGTILALTALNVFGVRLGSWVQNVLSALKLLALLGFIVAGLWVSFSGAPVALTPAAPVVPVSSPLAGFGLALVAALWAYDGWGNLNFSAGEIKAPGRNIPRALVLGTLVITGVYLLVNLVYLRALPWGDLQGVARIAEKAANALFGPAGGAAMAAAVAISALGSTHGTALAGARVFYAMARDGLFFAPVGRVHPRFHTPHVALWLQGGWTALVTLSGRFDQLFTYAMFGALLLYAAGTLAVFRLRQIRPDLPRPYRAWGYPWVPATYVLTLLALALTTLVERPTESLVGVALLALGVPAYRLWRRPQKGASHLSG